MKYLNALPLIAGFVLVVGCKQETPADTAKAADKPATSTDVAAKTGAEQPKAGAPAKAPEAGDIPATLKSDAYDYFGLANSKPIDYEMRTEGKPEIGTGSIKTEFAGMKNRVATYTTTRTGALEQFGATDSITLEPDGIYTVSTSAGKMNGKHLELPSKLVAGTKWSDKMSLETTAGQKMEGEDSFAAKGTESVQTKAGKYQALRVESTGTAVIDGQKVRTENRYWYVRGKGFVKFESKVTPEKGKSLQVTLIESNSGSK